MKTIHRSILALVMGLALTVCSFAHVYADALQLDFLLSSIQDVSGDPISGAIIVTRNSANSAAKAVWEDKDQTLPSALGKSQFNLDSEGRAVVFGDGVYTIIVYAAADTGLTSPLYTFSGVSYDASILNLADNAVGSGSDLVAHTGTARTVTGTLDGYDDGTVALAAPTVTSFANSTHTHADAAGGGNTLTTPTIADFSNAAHDHADAAGGGLIAILPVDTFAGGDATPSVADGKVFKGSLTTANITTFDDGVDGQEIVVLIQTGAKPTFVNGATLKLAGAVDFTGTAADDTISFVYIDAVWYETARSIN